MTDDGAWNDACICLRYMTTRTLAEMISGNWKPAIIEWVLGGASQLSPRERHRLGQLATMLDGVARAEQEEGEEEDE